MKLFGQGKSMENTNKIQEIFIFKLTFKTLC